MDFIPLGLDSDGSLSAQRQLFSQLAERVDLRSQEGNLRLWANRRGIAELRSRIAGLRQKYSEPWLAFIGSGDFHHVSYFLIETLPKERHPVTVIIIDNHPDWFTHRPRFHCGNWVSSVLRFPWIQSVLLVGQDSPDLEDRHFWAIPFQALCQGRLRLHPYERRRIRAFLRWPSQVLGGEKLIRRFYGTDLYFKTVASQGPAAFFRDLAEQLKGRNLYLSIDKDCLEKRVAVTDWEQGRLSLKGVLKGIEQLKQTCAVVGADICGERAPAPLKGILKRIDAGRMGPESSPLPEIHRLNEKTNLALLEIFQEIPKFDYSKL